MSRPKGCGRILRRVRGNLWIAYRARGEMVREDTGSTSARVAERMLQRRIVSLAYPDGPPRVEHPSLRDAADLWRGHSRARSTWIFTHEPSIQRAISALGLGPISDITEGSVLGFLRDRAAGRQMYDQDRSALLRLYREAWRAAWIDRIPGCLTWPAWRALSAQRFELHWADCAPGGYRVERHASEGSARGAALAICPRAVFEEIAPEDPGDCPGWFVTAGQETLAILFG